MRLLKQALLAAVLLCVALFAAACGGHHAPYKTLPRPTLPVGLTAPDCGSSPKQHVMGACLPHPKQKVSLLPRANSGITGPDLSNNDPIYSSGSWAAIAARNRFVYLKSVEGTGYYDSTAAAMAAQAKAHHLPVGGYDFMHVCGNSASGEAAFFVRALRAQGLLGAGTLPPAADVEYGSGSCGGRAWVESWVSTVYALDGHIWPIVYTGAWWWQPNLGSYWPGGLRSWISGYGVSYPYMPSGRSQLDLWQFSDHGYNGATSVDLSVWWRPVAEFNTFAHVGPPPPPPDPHHYLIHPTAAKFLPGGRRGGPFDSKYGKLDERLIRLQIVGAVAGGHKYAAYLKDVLEPRAAYLAARVSWLAWHPSPIDSPCVNIATCRPNWGVKDLGARYQYLIHAAHGQV